MPPFVIRVALLFSIHALPFAVSPPKVGHIFQGRRHLQPAWGTGGEITMDCCTKRRLLTVMTSVCACAAFGLLSISVATDYWLFTKEKAKETPGNKTVGAKYKCVYSGLWRRCKYDNDHKPDECSYIAYFTDEDREGLGPTDAILLNIRQATMFPLVSLLILLIGGIMCFIGHCNDNKKILTFVSGILFVLAGLCTLVGIILYIGSITGEVGNKPRASVEEPRFIYDYGSSFFMAVGSFVLTELSGVFSVYLYISKHKHSQRVKRLAIKPEHNDKNHQAPKGVRRLPRDKSRDRSLSCDRSRDPSTSRSESYFTYTPISATSHELSNYNFTRSATNNTISTTAELHGQNSCGTGGPPAPCTVRSGSQPSVIPCIDIVRRTTPV